MLSDEDIQDRIRIRELFDKTKINRNTKEGFFYFSNERYAITSLEETYIVINRDMAVGYPLFMDGEGDFKKFERAFSIIEDTGRNITSLFDIGANIGPICIPAVKRNFVKKAHAFEPELELFRLLNANIALNDLGEDIKTFRCALGNTTATVTLTLPERNTGDYRILGKLLENDSMGEGERLHQDVALKQLDTFLEYFEPDRTLLWLDVQGYEGWVLDGAPRILEHAPPIVAEFWPYGIERQSSLEAFSNIVCSGLYKSCVDLADSNPSFLPVSPRLLQDIYDRLGPDPRHFTDLLFL